MEAFHRAAIEGQMLGVLGVQSKRITCIWWKTFVFITLTGRQRESSTNLPTLRLHLTKGSLLVHQSSTKPLYKNIYATICLFPVVFFLFFPPPILAGCVSLRLHVIIPRMCPVFVAKERINRNLRTLLNTCWFDHRGPPQNWSWKVPVVLFVSFYRRNGEKSSAGFFLRPVPPTLKRWMQKFSPGMFGMTTKLNVLRYKMICIKRNSTIP